VISVTDYFNKVKTVVATIVAIGEPLKDPEAMAYLLASLDSDYESLVTAMTTRYDLVGLSELYGYLLNHESRNEKKNKTLRFSSLANQASRSGSSGGALKGGGNFGRGRGRGNGRGGGHGNNRPPCQIYKRTNHDEPRCYDRFDQSYQPEDHVAAVVGVPSASYQVDPNWYANSGATYHITYDLDHLTVKECSNGSNQVQVANGSGLKISMFIIH
jgi:hypothetical protein